MGPLLFLFYENYLPKIVQYNSKPTLFADDTSLIFSNPNDLDFKTTINNVFSQLNKWFNDDLYFQIKKNLNMSILLSKVLFFMKHQLAIIAVSFQILLVLKFLGVIIENTLSWKAHIDQLLPKLCMTCYSVRTIKPFMCPENLKPTYCTYFYSLMTYGIIFWGNSAPFHSFVNCILH